MQGKDKGLLTYQGRRLIEHVIDRLTPQCDDLLICANRNLEAYRALGYPVIADTDDDYQGPMAGVVSALSFLEPDESVSAVLIATCDTPYLPEDLHQKLAQALVSEGGSALADDGQRRQNLHCLLQRPAWKSLQAFYASGERAMHRWHQKAGSISVDFSDQAGCFQNLNRLEQL